MNNTDTDIIVALISFLAGILVALVGGLTKLLEYQLEKRKLEMQERQDIALVLGSSQANFVRAARELYRRISNFFDRPNEARQWLKPGDTSKSDANYLKEFVRLFLSFISLGKITQDTINSLPVTVTKERSDFQRTFVFVDLAVDVLAYRGLFQDMDDYNADDQALYLNIVDIEGMAEEGVKLWKENKQNISHNKFEELYHSPSTHMLALRDFLVSLHNSQTPAIGFILARLAALRAVLAGFLYDYSWTIYLPEEQTLIKELEDHLSYATETGKTSRNFIDYIPRNLGRLMTLYRCKLFRL